MSCACGGEARFAGRRPKTFTTALGALTLERAGYHCEQCHNGFSPRDRALGREHTFLSPAALRRVGIAGTSFEGSRVLLRELSGLAVAPNTVERHAEALGREVARDERGVIDPEPCEAPTLYLGLDGTGAPHRGRGPRGQAARWPCQDPRSQARRRGVGANHRPHDIAGGYFAPGSHAWRRVKYSTPRSPAAIGP